jgi:hypothetical protein
MLRVLSLSIKLSGAKWWVMVVPNNQSGGLAQLARASALHAEGQRFDSVILHSLTAGQARVYQEIGRPFF